MSQPGNLLLIVYFPIEIYLARKYGLNIDEIQIYRKKSPQRV
jgi:hypothetical protein